MKAAGLHRLLRGGARLIWLSAFWCAAAAHAADMPVQAEYAGYLLGVHVVDFDLGLSLDDAAYRLRVSFRLVGVTGALYHADGTSVVDGRFAAGRVLPSALLSTGRFGGVPHITQIGWKNGAPTVLQMTPGLEPDREAVPIAQQAETIDSLSAVAALVRQVTATGACALDARSYDGARLSEVSARTVGEESLAASDRSSFHGKAIRCDLTGRMIAGFMRDDDSQSTRRIKTASAWFARVQPGQPLLPVRVAFHSQGVPDATLYLK